MAKIYRLPSNKQWYDQDLVGMFAHKDAIRRAALSGDRADEGDEIVYKFPVTLVCEPDNPYEITGHAISARNGGEVLGYIPREDCGDYFPEIARLIASDYIPQVEAKLWCSRDILDPHCGFGMWIDINPPGRILPKNSPPEAPWVLIPHGTAMRVAKESKYLEVLKRYLPSDGVDSLLVTLHKVLVGPESQVGIEVRVDDQAVGRFYGTNAKHLIPIVDRIVEAGFIPVTNATIGGSKYSVELSIYAKRAHQLENPEFELDIAPYNKLVPFEEDPHRYDIPDAYQGPDVDGDDDYYSDHYPDNIDIDDFCIVDTDDDNTAAYDSKQEKYASEPSAVSVADVTHAWRSETPTSEKVILDIKTAEASSPVSPVQPLLTVPATASMEEVLGRIVDRPYAILSDEPIVTRARIRSWLMWLLWLFTGLVGGHRYYLGNIGIGLMQTTAFILGGLGVDESAGVAFLWWLVDAFLINRRRKAIVEKNRPRWKF